MGIAVDGDRDSALTTSLAAVADKLATLPLLFEPGSRWHYSLATDVCGRLVEVLAGMPFGEFLRSQLFAPLGMDSTFFTVPALLRERQADVYRPDFAGRDSPPRARASMTDIHNISDVAGQDFTVPHSYEMGGGGLCSTLHDYWRFAAMLCNKGTLDGQVCAELQVSICSPW